MDPELQYKFGALLGCRLWQAITDSYLLHRKRWIIGAIVATLLLLLIILLSALVPRSGPKAPRFLQASESRLLQLLLVVAS